MHPSAQNLKRRAKLVVETLNGLEGVTCNPSEGALYVRGCATARVSL